MRLMVGWSGEQPGGTWRKIEVELDETDLGRLCADTGLLSSDAYEAASDLPLAGAFTLLENEAQRLLLVELLTRHPEAVPHGRHDLAVLNERRDKLVTTLRASAPSRERE